MPVKIRAVIFGKKNCSLCENRKTNLERFPQIFYKQTGQELQMEIQYWDIGTVEGLVRFCLEERTNSDIPIVILEDDKGKTFKIYNGPSDLVSSKNLLEILAPAASK